MTSSASQIRTTLAAEHDLACAVTEAFAILRSLEKAKVSPELKRRIHGTLTKFDDARLKMEEKG